MCPSHGMQASLADLSMGANKGDWESLNYGNRGLSRISTVTMKRYSHFTGSDGFQKLTMLVTATKVVLKYFKYQMLFFPVFKFQIYGIPMPREPEITNAIGIPNTNHCHSATEGNWSLQTTAHKLLVLGFLFRQSCGDQVSLLFLLIYRIFPMSCWEMLTTGT